MSVPVGYSYAYDVVEGRIESCEYLQKACQRAISDLKDSREGRLPWVYHEGSAQHFLSFVSMCQHSKGPLARTEIRFEPWQQFFFCQLMAWRDPNDLEVRRFREAILFVGRKAGKTTMMSVFALYSMLFEDYGGEVYSISTKRDQSKIIWDSAAQILALLPEQLKSKYKTTTNAISCKDNNSKFVALSKESSSLDGLNPSVVLVDESAAITDNNLIDVMESAMGARKSPLMVHLTTANFSRSTRFYEKLTYARTILDGITEDNNLFAAIYELDKDDDYTHQDVWVKSNPCLGASLSEEFITRQVEQSISIKSKKNEVLVKHFNVFSNMDDAWLDVTPWDASSGPIDRSGPCYMAFDLASTRDLTALCWVWQHGEKLHAEFKCWLPRGAMSAVPPAYRGLYEEAIDNGTLILTEGPVTDYNMIQGDILRSAKEYKVATIAYDAYNATQLVSNLEDAGLPLMRVGQGIASLSGPSKETEILIEEGKIVHEPNRFITWCLENCCVYTDVNGNIKVKKSEDPNRKIDPVIAMIMAVAVVPEAKPVGDLNFVSISF